MLLLVSKNTLNYEITAISVYYHRGLGKPHTVLVSVSRK